MDTTQALFDRLEQLNDIGASLAKESELDLLLEKILVSAKMLTGADGGTLYLVTEDRRHLQFKIVRTDSLHISLGGSSTTPIPPTFKDLPLYLPDGSPNENMVSAHVALSAKTVVIPDAYHEKDFDFSGTRAFDARTGYRSKSFLTVPMQVHEDPVVGVLQLMNSIDPDTGEIRSFTEADRRLAESLASQATVAITNRRLVKQMESLFESFVELIDTAIDEKSPYTGGHCARVPELTMLLAEAVNETRTGPLAPVNLTKKDLYELRIAALLHDCGKITTPVHVVDKATKLETIFDRIEWVATRMEVLKREAQTDMWRAIAQGAPAEAEQTRCAQRVKQIEDDCAFLRQSNRGGERMGDEAVQRVKDIAARYRLGGADGQDQPLLSEEEVMNLTIRAGTLNAAEREVINHHIVATIQMLQRLPWPAHLQNIPEFAGGHHERMDGKGYPKGLTREQMSWQARMMGIADIFEALTASDRPYKPPMKLSLALSIMNDFRDKGHIDPDLYQVFLEHRVPQKYAEKFLAEAQRDVA